MPGDCRNNGDDKIEVSTNQIRNLARKQVPDFSICTTRTRYPNCWGKPNWCNSCYEWLECKQGKNNRQRNLLSSEPKTNGYNSGWGG